MQSNSEPQPATRKYGSIMIYLMWIALLGLFALLMQTWLEKRYNPNSDGGRIVNGREQQLVLQRNPYGHYIVSGQVNGQPAVFMLDTGATDIVIPEALAKQLNLSRGYPINVRTANGTITAYTTKLDRVTLGPIEQYDVPASINPHMNDDEVLLGMSFLKHLRLIQEHNQLILSQP